MELNNYIKILCKSKNIKLKDLAIKVNMDNATLSRAIHGNPTLKTLESIAEALNISITDLLRYKDFDSNNTIIIDGVQYFIIKKS